MLDKINKYVKMRIVFGIYITYIGREKGKKAVSRMNARDLGMPVNHGKKRFSALRVTYSQANSPVNWGAKYGQSIAKNNN
jgi:hypothetical protein